MMILVRIVRLAANDRRVHLARSEKPGRIPKYTRCGARISCTAKTRCELRDGDAYCQTCLSTMRVYHVIRLTTKDKERFARQHRPWPAHGVWT